MILTESLQVSSYKISEETKSILRIFQEALASVYDFYHSSIYGDKRGEISSSQEFKQLKVKMRRYHNYPFMKPLFDQIDQLQKEMIENTQARREAKKSKHELTTNLEYAISVWNSRNVTSAISAGKRLSGLVRTNHKAGHNPLKNKRNPFYIENPLFFGSNNFLTQFEQSDMRLVIGKDLDVYEYSELPLNELSKNDFQYLAYFIMELKKDPSESELSGTKLRKYFDMAYGGYEYKELIKHVKRYLSDNDKSRIPIILEMIERFPEIKQANENSKIEISNDGLYRGFPDDPDFYREELPKFMATSKSRHVAERFAMQIGHLESEENRRSDTGIIQIIHAPVESIILDTTIFGGIFGEQEVIVRGDKIVIRDEETI